ncbi:MAG: hypothetical protein JHD28_10075 [Bacteroidia bacterium]|nr:hypothetical protein [Bacteroidia bacterium]
MCVIKNKIFIIDDRTKEITKRFADSWIETELFYNDLITNHKEFERLKPIIQFIEFLKQNGEDKFFRLGTSIHILVISRSVNYGLRKDQKYIKIEAFDNKFEIKLGVGNKTYRQYLVASLHDTSVTKLLETLKETLID